MTKWFNQKPDLHLMLLRTEGAAHFGNRKNQVLFTEVFVKNLRSPMFCTVLIIKGHILHNFLQTLHRTGRGLLPDTAEGPVQQSYFCPDTVCQTQLRVLPSRVASAQTQSARHTPLSFLLSRPDHIFAEILFS